MTSEPRPGEIFEIEPSYSEGLLARLPWWLIGTLAVLVAEITTHPTIGVVVFCVKFGWSDFLTAMWLRRRDPVLSRGRICAWFYAASGLWRVCVSAFLMTLIVIFVVVATDELQQQGNPNNEPPPEFAICMIIWITSFGSATLLTVFAIAINWRRRIKVWISGSLKQSRIVNQWPPRPSPRLRPETNMLKWWLIGAGAGISVFLSAVGIALCLLIVGVVGQRGPAGQQAGLAEFFGAILGVCFPISSAFLILVVGGRFLDRIGANCLVECWPDYDLQTADDLTN